jgi:predicted transcriptional regulator
MDVGAICTREVVSVDGDTGIEAAVELMRRRHVGDLVVVEPSKDGSRPIGILTDRDIVVELLAPHVELGKVCVRDAMSAELLTAKESDDVADTVARMRDRGVRRAPVVDDDGSLVGILAVDDMVQEIAGQLAALAQLLGEQPITERSRRP